MKRIQRLAAWGLLAAPLLACPLAVASQGEAARPATPPAEAGASTPRTPAPRDSSGTPAPADRLDPHAIGRAASYPGVKRRVFPAE